MRVMVLVKATADSEAGAKPRRELFEAMGKYNQELIKAGIMVTGDGLRPSSQGKRIAFDGADRTVYDGPFSATSELVAGFWLGGAFDPSHRTDGSFVLDEPGVFQEPLDGINADASGTSRCNWIGA